MSMKTATEHMSQTTGHLATGVAGGSGLISYIAENSAAIGVLISITSLLIGLMFYWLNYKLASRRTLILEQTERDKIRMQVFEEFQKHGLVPSVPLEEVQMERRSKVIGDMSGNPIVQLPDIRPQRRTSDKVSDKS